MADDELSQQVSQLSTRLIQAIDRQADLEDQLQVLRKELEVARRRNLSFEDKLASGELVTKAVFQKQANRANAASKAQVEAEKESARLQAEIEELTSSLFNEANKMVADANRETSVWGRKNDTLRQQIRERDVLLENMQEQLTALKAVLQDVSDDRDRLAKSSGASDTTANNNASLNSTGEFFKVALNTPKRPVLRHDLPLYREFLLMTPPSTSAPDLGSSGKSSPTSTDEGAISSIASRIHTFNSKDTPSLKDFKFFKRSIGEDIEPTLRLDTAPGLTWLSRRNILSSIYDGSIKVEPIAAVNEAYKLAYSIKQDPVPQLTHSSTHSSQLSQSSIITQATQGSQSGSQQQQQQQQQVPVPEQVQSKVSFVASTDGKEVCATLIGCPIPGDLSSSVRAAPPVATLTPCSMCGEKRSSSLLYARLHNLRADKEKDGRDRSSSLSTPNLQLARDYFSIGSSEKTPKRSSVNGQVNNNNNNNNSSIDEEETEQFNGNSNTLNSRDKDEDGGYMPLTPSLSSSSSLTSATNNSNTNTSTSGNMNTSSNAGSNANGNTHNSTGSVGTINTQSVLTSSMTTASTSSGYPLCYQCLHRIRSVCDYVSFVRAVRLGVWKTDDAASHHRAWEECIRLKERMFWARQGAGFLDQPMIMSGEFEGPNEEPNTGEENGEDKGYIDDEKKEKSTTTGKGLGGFYGVPSKSSVSVETNDFEDAEEGEKDHEEEENDDDDEIEVTEVAPASANKRYSDVGAGRM